MRMVTQVGEPEAAYAASLGKMMLSDRSDEDVSKRREADVMIKVLLQRHFTKQVFYAMIS